MTVHWRGIYKLIEEMGELSQVLGKLCVFPDGEHPGHSESLLEMLNEELTDLNATIDWFMNQNDLELDLDRYLDKYALYDKWVLSGITKENDVSTTKTEE